MSNGVIDIRENEIIDINQHLNKGASKAEQLSQNITSSFSSITKTGLLSTGTSVIGRQVNTIASQIERTNTSVTKSYENMKYIEKRLEEKVNEINAPTDFYKNDSSREVTTGSFELSKDDGKSINTNSLVEINDTQFKSALEYNEKIKNIVNDYEVSVGQIEMDVDKVELGKVNNNSEVVENDIENISIEKESVNNINKTLGENTSHFDNSSQLNKINISSLDNFSEEKNDEKELSEDEVYSEALEELRKKVYDKQGDFDEFES